MTSTDIKFKEIAAIIDHTNLNPWATKEDIIKLCEEAHNFRCAAVCVNESRIKDAVFALKRLKSKVKVCCVIGFPLGACTTTIKVCSALDAIKNGADEVDMVINIGFLRDMDYERFEDDIKAVMEAVDEHNRNNKDNRADKASVALKFILENCYLTDEEIIKATSTIAAFAGEHPAIRIYVKTSTGFGTPAKGPVPKKKHGAGLVNSEVGATVYDVELMRKAIDEITQGKYAVGIKAAGSIRDRNTAINIMKAAGCFDGAGKLKRGYKEFFRIGASATREICKQND